MSWGIPIGKAYYAVTGAVRDGVMSTLSSIGDAATAVKETTAAAIRAAGNVASFTGRATVETATALARGGAMLGDTALERSPFIGRPYIALKKIASPSQPPRKTAVEPCPNTLGGKRKRLEERRSLIDLGNSPRATPEQKAAAQRLARNNEAVELARLSGDTYSQYGKPPTNDPPLGWAAMTRDEVLAAGIDPKLLSDSKAVVYRTPSDWPGGQKTVVAFRGTVPSEADDLRTNLDQALGKETVQYEAAKELGRQMSEKFGTGVLVTGHSLGGGKAQAAGASGGLMGIMFNSAGLNPRTVNGNLPLIGQNLQYRSPGDPLTAVQNSAALQGGVGLAGAIAMPLAAGTTVGNFITQKLGLPILSADSAESAVKASTAFPRAVGNLLDQGNMLPPAIGHVIEAPSIDSTGKSTAATDLAGQHSVGNLINGIEREKSEDVATLQETL